MEIEIDDYVIDIYENKGKVVEIFYDYVRLDTGKHVYKNAIVIIDRT